MLAAAGGLGAGRAGLLSWLSAHGGPGELLSEQRDANNLGSEGMRDRVLGSTAAPYSAVSGLPDELWLLIAAPALK